MNTPELIIALTPLVSLLATSLVNYIFPRVSGWILPIVAGAIGILPDLIHSVLANIEASPLIAAFAGLTATALHQIKQQWNKRSEDRDAS